jgi:patatin-related protein
MSDSDAMTAERGSEFLREVRLGLVLYGGVSLAIYLNGTTNELYRAVRGRGVYFLIKHLLGADITVDVASGASAGGINGIFLSFALANGREFGTCAELWRRDGDLGTLLRRIESGSVPSVLDSDHYRNLLENGFRVMWENESRPTEPERPSATRELDLFVTGTNFYGRYSLAVDSSGRLIETKQHRTVFLLKHRERTGSKCQLDPRRNAYGRWDVARGMSEDDLDGMPEVPVKPPSPNPGLRALAKLAQITSCFPGAFAAVHVDAAREGDGTTSGDADQKLKVWGQLPIGEHYFVDGGVLDNKPFTTTLDAIFHRTADRRVCRHMLYLEPDPERFSKERQQQIDALGRLKRPTFIESVIDSMTRLPSYESIADDLARIAEHNGTIQRFDELVEGLGKTGGGASTRTYHSARLLALGERVNSELAEALASVEFVPARGDRRETTRLSAQAIEQVLRGLTGVIQNFPQSEIAELLRKVDVDFYIRRLLALAYVLESRLDGKSEERKLWRYVNQELQWLEVVRAAMERVAVPPWVWRGGAGFDETVASVDPKALWQEIERRIALLLDPAVLDLGSAYSRGGGQGARRELPSPAGLRPERLRRQLDQRIREIGALGSVELEREQLPGKTLLEDSDERLRAFAETHPLLQEFFARFEQQEDPLRFPLEFAARVHQRDKIHTLRLSPVDAQTAYSRGTLEAKICGETFGHFGAFLKKSWRSNDILWGRLDGISRLSEILLVDTCFGGVEAKLDRAALLAALGSSSVERRAFLGELFPHLEKRLRAHATPEQEDPLATLLGALEAAGEPARETLVQLFTETAQLDALCEDLPKVIADAAEEQLEWGQVKVDGKTTAEAAAASFSPAAWEFKARSGALKTNVLDLAAASFAKRALAEKSVREVGEYFRNTYSVGGESAFRAMPVTVLADLGARVAVLAERALVGSGELGQTLKTNGLYRIIVRAPLRVIAVIATFLRRSPQWRVAVVTGFLLYVLLALVANVFFAGAFYTEGGFQRTVAIWAFAILPLSALVAAWIFWRSPWGKRLLVALVFAAAVAALWWKFDDLARVIGQQCAGVCQALGDAEPEGQQNQ